MNLKFWERGRDRKTSGTRTTCPKDFWDQDRLWYLDPWWPRSQILVGQFFQNLVQSSKILVQKSVQNLGPEIDPESQSIHGWTLTHSYNEYPHLSLLWRIKITAPEISSLAPPNLSPHNSSRRLSYSNLLYK